MLASFDLSAFSHNPLDYLGGVLCILFRDELHIHLPMLQFDCQVLSGFCFLKYDKRSSVERDLSLCHTSYFPSLSNSARLCKQLMSGRL